MRRAYSVSALAAPAFVATACGDQVLETLRLGDGEVPICRLRIRPNSPLIEKSASDVKARFGCAVLARSGDCISWQPVYGDAARETLSEGEHLLLGGPREAVLRAVTQNAGWHKARRRKWRQSGKPAPMRRPTLLPKIAAVLTAVLVASVFVFGHALHLRLVDAIYFVVTTATTTGYGDISLKDGPDWLKLFGCGVMLTGGALLGIMFSYLAAIATAERLDETMNRRTGRLSRHVVVAGLGNLGYRVTRQLTDLGMDVAVLDLAPRPRFAETLRALAPVLAGDASLPDNLERVSIQSAAAFLACTDNDLANIQACLHARRLQSRRSPPSPAFLTMPWPSRSRTRSPLTMPCRRPRPLSAPLWGRRRMNWPCVPCPLGDLLFLAGRYFVEQTLEADTLAGWRAAGVRVLAFRDKAGSLQAPSALNLPLLPGVRS